MIALPKANVSLIQLVTFARPRVGLSLETKNWRGHIVDNPIYC
jgi:hypothetical protein